MTREFLNHSTCQARAIRIDLRIISCTNANERSKAYRGIYYVKKWAEIYLKDAHARLQPQIKGFNLTIEDVHTMQQTCAYEVCSADTPPTLSEERAMFM